MFLWLIHPNLDHIPLEIQIILPPLENDGPHHFMLKKETRDYNVSVANEEKGFVRLTHNRWFCVFDP